MFENYLKYDPSTFPLNSESSLNDAYDDMQEKIDSGVRFVNPTNFITLAPGDNGPEWISPIGIDIPTSWTINAGYKSHANGDFAVAFGERCVAQGKNSFSTGRASLSNNGAFSAGYKCFSLGDYSFSVGGQNTAEGIASIALGNGTNAIGDYSTAIGKYTKANGHSSYAEGWGGITGNGTPYAVNTDTTDGYFAHVEGNSCQAKGNSSHAQGIQTEAGAKGSFSSGYFTKALGEYSFSGGCWKYGTVNGQSGVQVNTIAYGKASFAHGCGVQIKGEGAVGFGILNTIGSGSDGNAGKACTIFGCQNSINNANYSTIFGYNNITNGSHQVAMGYYNYPGYLFSIGNGSDTTRKNAFSLSVTGDAIIENSLSCPEIKSSLISTNTIGSLTTGKIYVGSTLYTKSIDTRGNSIYTNQIYLRGANPNGASCYGTSVPSTLDVGRLYFVIE